MIKSIYNKIYLPWYYRNYEFNPLKTYDFLLTSQTWNRTAVEAYQIRETNHLLKLARNKSTYYQEKLQHIPDPILSIDDLKYLPVVNKEIVIKNHDALIVDNKDSTLHVTSGSAGDPLSVWVSRQAEMFRLAGRMRYYSWWGITLADKHVLIWAKKATTKKNTGILTGLKKKIYNRRYFIDVFNLSKETIHYYYKGIQRYQPAYIRGYLSGIKQFVELMNDAGLKGEELGINYAIVTSEVLFPGDRELIEQGLNCRVINEYGSAEAGLFAMECPQGSLHVYEEAILMIPASGDEVHITELYNTSMPLINYNIGDKVFFSSHPCQCGRVLKVIDRIEGRCGDQVKKTNGEYLSQYTFYYLIKELDDIGFKGSIKKYRIVQNKNEFNFFIIRGLTFSDEVIKYIVKRMHLLIGRDIKVNFNFVDEIEKEKSGKLRFFIRMD